MHCLCKDLEVLRKEADGTLWDPEDESLSHRLHPAESDSTSVLAKPDDGGATPVQDERESGSDGEDNGNEQHSGSENGSIGPQSEVNELSDGEDDRQTGGHPMSDSENEDTPRQKHSDSENEDAPNHNASDSENEGAPKDSDSDNEDRPVQHASDSEDAVNNQASDSENEEPPKGHDSDSENEEPQKHLASDSENEGSQKGHTSDLENEEPQKLPTSDSENEEPQKTHDSDSDNEMVPKPLVSDSENEDLKGQPSDSETEDVSTNKQKTESGDSDRETKKEEEMENGAQLSDSEQLGKRMHGSDSEEESSPKKRKIVDSDEEEGKEEEKGAKRKAAVLSDSEDEDEKTPVKKGRIISDGEESDSDAASEKSEKQKKPVASDSEDQEDEDKTDSGKKKEEKDLFGSDSESGNEQENLIADIFGESGDEEEEEFTGFNQEDLEEEKAERKGVADDSDSDDNIKRGKHMDFMSDFDMMLQRKKSMSGKRRRNRDGGTFISDADDVVSAMIVKMNEAAEEDRTLNTQKKPALKKLTLLPTVVMHLKKQDLKETFIDSGVMSAIKEWLSPLPDRSLPALKIREELLKILQELPSVSQETLKHSGIGRAVMYLYKHPKESRPNKDMAGKLINEWSRPIFGLTSNYKGMTREEREQRDLEQMPQRRRLSSSGGQTPRRDLEKVLTGEEKALRPGDPGFCARARVPMPSNKDYVVRPKWNVEMETSRPGTVKKGISRLEKHKRRFAEQKRLSKVHRAVKFSIEGNRMPL
ncbi:protein IWS1 homolog isoform X3 [Hemicordylus capensis]|uniref:protein IWS1 homolog isoform X3 n=1 Tax=Hemicordylus capensis TaxID=884348 RepID=UPI00230445A1|nr:protein IWS1 homolog isoform X3 [Hemicordylus capensis]